MHDFEHFDEDYPWLLPPKCSKSWIFGPFQAKKRMISKRPGLGGFLFFKFRVFCVFLTSYKDTQLLERRAQFESQILILTGDPSSSLNIIHFQIFLSKIAFKVAFLSQMAWRLKSWRLYVEKWQCHSLFETLVVEIYLSTKSREVKIGPTLSPSWGPICITHRHEFKSNHPHCFCWLLLWG